MNKYRKDYKNYLQSEKDECENGFTSYGRCIDFSTGLIVGLLLDKSLFIATKGFSVIFPPLAVLLMSRGRVLFSWRFEKRFNRWVEKYIVSHVVKK